MVVHRTAKGTLIDMDKIKLMNEKLITVGNTRTNVRGDVIQGGKIIKTREQITRETYNLNGNNLPNNVAPKKASIQPDVIAPSEVIAPPDDVLMDTISPFEDLQNPESTTVIEQKPLDNKPRGGLADAVSRSKDLNEKLEAQGRKKI
jgi:hypothetical protein